MKTTVEGGDNAEYFWLSDVSFRNDTFEGSIANDPGIVGNVTIGQKWTVSKAEVSDWMHFRDDKMYGNFTMRPLLKAMSEDRPKGTVRCLPPPEFQSNHCTNPIIEASLIACIRVPSQA